MCWQPQLAPKAQQVRIFQTSGREVSLTREDGKRSLMSTSPQIFGSYEALASAQVPFPPYKILSRLVAVEAVHPEPLGASVIRCLRRGREQDKAFRVPPPPTVLSPHPSNMRDGSEWPPGGRAAVPPREAGKKLPSRDAVPTLGQGAGQGWVVLTAHCLTIL